jgi:hypothetical protein
VRKRLLADHDNKDEGRDTSSPNNNSSDTDEGNSAMESEDTQPTAASNGEDNLKKVKGNGNSSSPDGNADDSSEGSETSGRSGVHKHSKGAALGGPMA